MAKNVETKANIKIVTDTKGLNALIASIGKGRAKLEAQINAAVVGCVFHAAEHGDCRLATKLVNTLGDKVTGIRSNAVIKWFELYGAMKWTKGEDGSAFKINKDAMEALRSQIEADKDQVLLDLQETTPWKLSPQAEYKGFNFIKELQALVNKATNKQGSDEEAAKAEQAGVELNFDGLPQAAKFLSELNRSFGKAGNVDNGTNARVH